jgi:c(7)-type cytochrome triheme protein
MQSRLLRVLLVCLAGGLGAGALAENLKQLPPDYRVPQSEESPGPVTFRHGPHVEADPADCTACHPLLFKITERGKTVDGDAIKHARMKMGGQCGACHDGKKVFGLDECERCHAME